MKNNKAANPEECCAEGLLEVVPSIMCSLRGELKSDELGELTAQQFRILYLLNRGERSSSELANCTHSSRPAMTRLIDGLVNKGLVSRVEHPDDRRHVTIALTKKGEASYKEAYRGAKSSFRKILEPLSKDKQNKINEALEILSELFPLEPTLA